MRLCELADYFDKYTVLGPSNLDSYIINMKEVQSKTNNTLESILNKFPLCISHKDKTDVNLKALLEELEANNYWTPNFSKINLMLNNCSYEVELFKVKYLGYKEGKAIFKFKDRNVSVYFNNKAKLEINKDYLILADFYYTVTGISNNFTYLSVHDIIEINDNIAPYFKDYSETHFDTIYLCYPINKPFNFNFGLATKCKQPRRNRIYEAVVSKNINLLTIDDVKDLCVNIKETNYEL